MKILKIKRSIEKIGVKVYGNRKFSNKKTFCEYSHPTRLDSHKFWQECD